MSGSTTLTTIGDRQRQRRVEGTAAFLFLVLACDKPTDKPARYCLGKVHSIAIGRGDSRSAQIDQENSLRTLTIQCEDARMSSAHARFEYALGHWILVDSDSKNGTFVNGQRLDRAKLSDGDLIELGHTVFLFRESLPLSSEAIKDGSSLAAKAQVLSTLSPGLELEFEKLVPIAESKIPVIVGGETGCGKELVARAIHALSKRGGVLIAVNCGALPEHLVEAELFGHKRGAFSGATSDRPGHVRAAHEGTLLLDEIGDLPASSQASLLRVLQEGEVVPVGASIPVLVDVRVIAATHRDLDTLAEEGSFRADLLARLAGFRFRIPALRERREDLGLIIGALLHRIAGKNSKVSISVPAARLFLTYGWPGNVRELEKCLETAVALSAGGHIDVEHLSDSMRTSTPKPRGPRKKLSPVDESLRAEVVASLQTHQGNIAAAARELGKARQQVQRWVKRLEIDTDDYRD